MPGEAMRFLRPEGLELQDETTGLTSTGDPAVKIWFEADALGWVYVMAKGGPYDDNSPTEIEWTDPETDLPFCAELDARLGTEFLKQAAAHHFAKPQSTHARLFTSDNAPSRLIKAGDAIVRIHARGAFVATHQTDHLGRSLAWVRDQHDADLIIAIPKEAQ